jgi:hypothetical protein
VVVVVVVVVVVEVVVAVVVEVEVDVDGGGGRTARVVEVVGTVDDADSSEAPGSGDVPVAARDSAGCAAGGRLSTVVVHAASSAAEAAIHIVIRRVVTSANVPILGRLVPAGRTLE